MAGASPVLSVFYRREKKETKSPRIVKIPSLRLRRGTIYFLYLDRSIPLYTSNALCNRADGEYAESSSYFFSPSSPPPFFLSRPFSRI